jgi:hypothetical protein
MVIHYSRTIDLCVSWISILACSQRHSPSVIHAPSQFQSNATYAMLASSKFKKFDASNAMIYPTLETKANGIFMLQLHDQNDSFCAKRDLPNVDAS